MNLIDQIKSYKKISQENSLEDFLDFLDKTVKSKALKGMYQEFILSFDETSFHELCHLLSVGVDNYNNQLFKINVDPSLINRCIPENDEEELNHFLNKNNKHRLNNKVTQKESKKVLDTDYIDSLRSILKNNDFDKLKIELDEIYKDHGSKKLLTVYPYLFNYRGQNNPYIIYKEDSLDNTIKGAWKTLDTLRNMGPSGEFVKFYYGKKHDLIESSRNQIEKSKDMLIGHVDSVLLHMEFEEEIRKELAEKLSYNKNQKVTLEDVLISERSLSIEEKVNELFMRVFPKSFTMFCSFSYYDSGKLQHNIDSGFLKNTVSYSCEQKMSEIADSVNEIIKFNKKIKTKKVEIAGKIATFSLSITPLTGLSKEIVEVTLQSKEIYEMIKESKELVNELLEKSKIQGEIGHGESLSFEKIKELKNLYDSFLSESDFIGHMTNTIQGDYFIKTMSTQMGAQLLEKENIENFINELIVKYNLKKDKLTRAV